MQLQFDRVMASEGSPVVMSTTVMEVENAREQVSKGVIQGVRSSDSPQGTNQQPPAALAHLEPIFRCGADRFQSNLSHLSRAGDLFPVRHRPPHQADGTNYWIGRQNPSHCWTHQWKAPLVERKTSELESFAQSLPQHSTTVKLVDADVVNLVFVGSRQEVESAFEQAGWSTSDAFNRKSFFRDFYAFLNNSGYAQAPMRPFLLDGKPADMNWQKSLNSYARRDHLRMWQWSGPEAAETVWVSSATHDTGATLSLERHQFVHHITSDIDEERSKVIRDLNVAGCVKAVHLVPRPKMATISQNSTGDLVTTDGALAVVELKECQPMVPGLASETTSARFRPGNHIFRYFRRQILTFRSDIWRANIIYGAYDLTRMSIVAWRHHSAVTTNREANAYLLRAQ